MPNLATSALTVALVIAIVAAALLGWFCYRLLVDRGHLLLRLSPDEPATAGVASHMPGLPAGSYLSDFALPALTGAGDNAIVTLSALLERPLLLLFLHPDCLFSRALVRELAGWDVAFQAPAQSPSSSARPPCSG